MLVVETIAKIRRAHFIQGKSIKQICREFRLSRSEARAPPVRAPRRTARKVIRSGATVFSYDRSSQPRPKIDPWRSQLDDMLADNARRPKRERLTLVRVYEELRNQGFVTVTRANQRNRNDLKSSSNDLIPFGKCLGARLTESRARDQMTLQIEMVVDGIVDGQKTLHRSGRLEPAHSAISCVDARLMQEVFQRVMEHVIRCSRVSGL